MNRNVIHIIARRYLFSRKKKSVVNIISWISLIGLAVGTTALIVVLSVYNGIGNITQSLFNVFDPELIIEPAKGKTFHTSDIDFNALINTPGVVSVSQIVEENAWITNKQNESIVQLRGVDSSYAPSTGLDTMLYEGTFILSGMATTTNISSSNEDEDEYIPISRIYFLVFGGEVYSNLGIATYSNTPVSVHIPKRSSGMGMSIDEAFNNGVAYPAGFFFIQQEIDSKYVIADIDFVRGLMDYSDDEVTSLAITTDGHGPRVQSAIQKTLGDQYTIKDRFQQQPLYYKVFKSERLGIILILSLIILIATLNLVASLSLLIIDKKKDISMLLSLGMTSSDVRRIFFTEGIMIAAVGVIVGLSVGFVICLLQQQFGIIKMGHNFVVSAFPVAMKLSDFIFTFFLVVLLSTGSVFLTVRRAKIQ